MCVAHVSCHAVGIRLVGEWREGIKMSVAIVQRWPISTCVSEHSGERSYCMAASGEAEEQDVKIR